MSAGCVMRAAWLALGVLVWTQPHAVTGLHGSDTPLEQRPSLRLFDLLKIASRLDQPSMSRQKRLADIDDQVDIDSAPQRLLSRKTGNVHDSSKSVESPLERKRRGTAWDDMHDKYTLFHTALSDLINDLPAHFKAGSPQDLQYISIIPTILPINDPDFVFMDEDRVVDRIITVMGFTERLLQGGRQYVKNDSLAWFDNAAATINLWSSLVQLTLAHVRLADDTGSYLPLGAGMGSVNAAKDGYVHVNVDHLRALLAVL